MRPGKKWLIVHEEPWEGDMESSIAHEIAHAWRGHDQTDLAMAGDVPLGTTSSPVPRVERQAHSLAVEWGFSKCYPNVQR
jgi:hypothetical protein